MSEVFRTDRLRVREWEDGDTDFVLDMYSRWEVVRWRGSVPRALTGRAEAVAGSGSGRTQRPNWLPCPDDNDQITGAV